MPSDKPAPDKSVAALAGPDNAAIRLIQRFTLTARIPRGVIKHSPE
jgi:hypothetical protein